MSNIGVVSLIPIYSYPWVFKVSANNAENGVLVIAYNQQTRNLLCRYFLDSSKARVWVDSLVGDKLENQT